ncbi:cytidine deoxycytidylate deaminase family protein [Podospora didyma]|uniref:Cytidine deoxycytidylate deaminase family protein n=1 Tax=Podospora didyma TaxID=330526 RepID=A0AAE0U001_9PEZI|nr:cytidine deoxycytidylate deaminase family protein [Podospora didyma]
MAATAPETPAALISGIVKVTEETVIPLLREGVAAGHAPFGAAILLNGTLALHTAATNHHQDWPLLHGETNCIREFFIKPASERPDPKDTVFFSTHEPCSLCLSGISWTAFPRLYYLFNYEDTRDLLGVDGDIDILQEVFRVPAPGDTKDTLAGRPLYNKKNKYFTSVSVAELLDQVEDAAEQEKLRGDVKRVRELFSEFNAAAAA